MTQKKQAGLVLLAAGAVLILNMPARAAGPAAIPYEGISRLKVDVAQNAAETFISVMAQKAIDFLGDPNLTEEKRRGEFRRLLDQNYDMATIGRFCLGRYWNTATPQQRAEYQTLFRKMIVEVYSNRFKEYSGQDLQVRGSRADGNDTIVASFIVPKNGGAEVQVDWRVRGKPGHYKIVDVVVEGVSMSVTQRSDFAAVIQRGGGSVAVLLDHLRGS